jgi:hypothetical protein
MSFEVTDLIENARQSRLNLLKHTDGMTGEQWTWKPYPECKNVRETMLHLLMGDALVKLRLENDPRATDFNGVAQEIDEKYADFTPEQLVEEVQRSHSAKLDLLLQHYEGKPLDTPWVGFLGEQKLGLFLANMVSENGYHTGQIAFIRMATDPAWDYYGHMFNYKG